MGITFSLFIEMGIYKICLVNQPKSKLASVRVLLMEKTYRDMEWVSLYIDKILINF